MELHVKLKPDEEKVWHELKVYLFGKGSTFVKNPTALAEILKLAKLAKEDQLNPD